MNKPSLGDQELEVLRYVTDHAPISVGEVAEHFHETRGLARTTILTVMERLRGKGYLTRKKDDGTYRYSPSISKEELQRSLARDFADRVFGGSLQPFVMSLAEDADLSADELQELKQLVKKLDTPRKKERS